MTSIERTAYPRFRRAPSVKELRDLFLPTPTDVTFVATRARRPTQKFALMILLKVYQRLYYFPDPQSIPGAVISHIRAVIMTNISPAMLYRYYVAFREHVELNGQGKHVRHVAAQVMNNPADLINATLETLLAQHCELPVLRIRTIHCDRFLHVSWAYLRLSMDIAQKSKTHEHLQGRSSVIDAIPYTFSFSLTL